MNKIQKKLVEDYFNAEISIEVLEEQFGVDLKENEAFVKADIKEAIEVEREDNLELSIHLLWLSRDFDRYIDILNKLLLVPHHRSHQVITKTLQGLKNPKSIPYIKKALETNFDYLAYTCSDSDVIAKWFSWALYAIGTKEAIDLIKEYANSEDEGIRNEMLYRLKRIK